MDALIGRHITWTANGRSYLATVVGIQVDSNGTMFVTRHFNGEPAPTVRADQAQVLRYEWETEEQS